MAKKEKLEKEKKEKDVKKKVKTNKKKEQKGKKESYMAGVSEELKKVKWPSKQEVFKYTVATIVFVLILVVFFLLLNLGMSVIKGAFN